MKVAAEGGSKTILSVCNKLSYENFDRLYPIILDYARREGIDLLIERGSKAESYGELYVRVFKKLQRDGLHDEVQTAMFRAGKEFADSGGLISAEASSSVATAAADEGYDDFCARLRSNRNRLALLKIIVTTLEDERHVHMVVSKVFVNFSGISADAASRDVVVDGFVIVHKLCPRYRGEALEMAADAMSAGGLDARTRFKVQDIIEMGDPVHPPASGHRSSRRIKG